MGGVCAVGVRSATVGGCTKGAAAITVFRIPVIGAGCWVRVLNLVHNTGIGRARRNRNIVRWHRGIALAVAEPDRVAMAKHDVVGAGSTVYRLVEIVAHRIGIGQVLEVRSVAVLNVIETHGGGTFAGGRGVGRIVGAEVGRLLESVCARAYRGFNPGKQGCVAAGRIRGRCVGDAAIQLLPHLVEAMHRAGRVGVVGKRRFVGQLKWSGRKCTHVLDAGIGNLAGQA